MSATLLRRVLEELQSTQETFAVMLQNMTPTDIERATYTLARRRIAPAGMVRADERVELIAAVEAELSRLEAR